jgi:hypothetical protein
MIVEGDHIAFWFFMSGTWTTNLCRHSGAACCRYLYVPFLEFSMPPCTSFSGTLIRFATYHQREYLSKSYHTVNLAMNMVFLITRLVICVSSYAYHASRCFLVISRFQYRHQNDMNVSEDLKLLLDFEAVTLIFPGLDSPAKYGARRLLPTPVHEPPVLVSVYEHRNRLLTNFN